jgi:hypothetical protein
LTDQGAVASVADQRAVQEQLSGFVDHVEERLQGVRAGGLRCGVCLRAAEQRLHELVMKRRGLGAQA